MEIYENQLKVTAFNYLHFRFNCTTGMIYIEEKKLDNFLFLRDENLSIKYLKNGGKKRADFTDSRLICDSRTRLFGFLLAN